MGKVTSINLCNLLDFAESISNLSKQLGSGFDFTSSANQIFNNYQILFKIDGLSIVELKVLSTITNQIRIIKKYLSSEDIISKEKFPEMAKSVEVLFNLYESIKEKFPDDSSVDKLIPLGCHRYDVVATVSGVALMNLIGTIPSLILLNSKYESKSTEELESYFANHIMQMLYESVRRDSVRSDIKANKFMYTLTGGTLDSDIKLLYLNHPMGTISFNIKSELEKRDYIKNVNTCKSYFKAHPEFSVDLNTSLSVSAKLPLIDIYLLDINNRIKQQTGDIPSHIPSYVELETPYYLVKYASAKKINLSDDIVKIYGTRISDVITTYYKNRENLRVSTNSGEDNNGNTNNGYGYMKELLLSGETLDVNCIASPKNLKDAFEICQSDDKGHIIKVINDLTTMLSM